MKSREERIEHFRKVVKAANDDDTNRNYYTIKNWRGKPLHRKIISIDSEYLMFRVENSRTEIQQLAYLRKSSLQKDFFSDPESPRVQEAQEEILIDMVKNKGKDLLEDLRLRKQDDSCIITYDGYIVNGNRRTAALKFLGDRYIDCVILPEDATPKDIYALEQQLQIAQDFREDYHWINELRNIRRGLEDKRFDFSEKDMATNLRLELKDLRVKQRMLDLIDAFLLWKKIPGEYDYPKLDDAEEILRQLEKAIKKYAKDNNKREALQNAVFNLIEERPSKGRLYGYVMDLIRDFDQVYQKMQQVVSPVSKPVQGVETAQEENLIDEILVDNSTTDTIFHDPTKASEVAATLVETIADVKAENKERRDTEAVYESVSAALRELQGLTIDNDTAKVKGTINKLEQIIAAANRLIKELKEIDSQ